MRPLRFFFGGGGGGGLVGLWSRLNKPRCGVVAITFNFGMILFVLYGNFDQMTY